MKILAVDTSAKAASAALLEDDRLIAESFVNTNFTHSQTLLPMIDGMLETAGARLAEVDAFAVSVGPGSFTGLRIGIGAVKGMAYGAGKPCVGVSTLEALALNLQGCEGILCSAMDARCRQVYTAIFEGNPKGITRLSEDLAIPLEELCEKLQKFPEKTVFFVGDGAELCYNTIGEKLPGCVLANAASRFQRAANVARAGMKKLLAGESCTAAELMPLYLRLPQAERERLKKLGQTEG